MPVASVDLGFGAVKALSDSGKRVTFPAVTAPAPRTLGFGDAANERYRLSIGDRDVFVGEAAMAHGGGRSLADRADRRTNLGDLLLAALHLLDLGGGAPVDVLLGLPISSFAHAEECRDLKARLGGLVGGVNGSPVRVGAAAVYPQGLGAYFAALSQHPDLATSAVGIVDVGYWTTDCVAVAPGGKVRPGTWGSLPAGMQDVLRQVQSDLEHRVQRPVDPLRLEAAVVGDSEYVHQGRAYPLRGLATDALRALAGTIIAHVQATWRHQLDALDCVLLAGGGGEALAPHLREVHANVLVLTDAAWANAEGYLAVWTRAHRGAPDGRRGGVA